MDKDYRGSIYKDYPTMFNKTTSLFDYKAAGDWIPCLGYYFRNWLPQNSSATIVDLGCGNGRVIYALKEMGYGNVSGIDVSESQLAIARQISPNVVQADVLDFLKGVDCSYDLIIALDLVEHLDKNEILVFIDACYGALRPGGRIVIQTPNACSPFFGSVRYGDFTHEVAFTPNLLGQLMSRAGFNEICSRDMPPVPFKYTLLSTVRFFLWRFISLLMSTVDLIESGSRGSSIYSRVFSISGVK